MNLRTLDLREVTPHTLRIPRTRARSALLACIAAACLPPMLFTVPAWQMLCVVLPVLGLLPELIQ
jgi:hypothetical protein